MPVNGRGDSPIGDSLIRPKRRAHHRLRRKRAINDPPPRVRPGGQGNADRLHLGSAGPITKRPLVIPMTGRRGSERESVVLARRLPLGKSDSQ